VKAIILTSTFLRHQFAINYLAKRLNVVGVWQEEKSFYPGLHAETEADHIIIDQHFGDRDDLEEAYFGENEDLKLRPRTVHRSLDPGEINDPSEAALMRGLCPDVVLVFGTGILRESVLALFAGRIINLHLGLSPYYRGSGTNFWPLVNREPEYAGATIHYLDVGIDTGPIIAHVQPVIKLGDGAHDIGNKSIQAGVAMLGKAALAHVRGKLRSVPQTERGRLYQRKDFDGNAVRRLQRNFETGMIEEYLSDKARRDSQVTLVPLKIT